MGNKSSTAGSSGSRVIGPHMVNDFIPYVFSYSEDTVATSCGSLLRIMKIHSRKSYDRGANVQQELKELLFQYGRSGNLAFWVTCIREKDTVSDSWDNKGDFSDVIHKSYFKANPQDMLVNTIYITAVTKSIKEPITDFVINLLHSTNQKKYEKIFKSKKHILDSEFELLFQKVSERFNCEKLEIKISDNDEEAFHPALEFAWRLISHSYRRFPVQMADISRVLASDLKLSFRSDMFVSECPWKKCIGVILEIKNYFHAKPDATEALLETDCDFTVTEFLNYVYTRKDLKKYKRQGYVATVSEDVELLDSSGLQDYINAMTEKYESRPFCEYKVFITITADNLFALKEKIQKVCSICAKIGLLLVKHDLRLEELYWMSLPGNFGFVSNTRLLPAKNVPWFTSPSSGLHKRFAKGENNFYEYTTSFYTMKYNPFHFSLQKEGQPGHILIMGYDQDFRTSITNFLISESRKIDVSFMIFDSSGKSQVFVRALLGMYKKASLDKSTNTLKINPFKLKNTEFNRVTLYEILRRMIGRIVISEEKLFETVHKAVDIIFDADEDKKNIRLVQEIFEMFGNDAARWIDNGPFAHFITDDEEEIPDALGIDFSSIMQYSGCTQVLMYYLLRQFEAKETEKSKILVMEEFVPMCVAFNTEEELKEWAKRTVGTNFISIFGSSNLQGALADKVLQCTKDTIKTRIMLPNSNMILDNNTSTTLGISLRDKSIVLTMPSLIKHLLIKQADDEALLLSSNIKDLVEDFVLSSGKESVKLMEEAISESVSSGKSNDWLPIFLKKCEALFL